MDADLDLLLTAVYVTADDLLPQKPGNAKRSVTDAEVVTLCVAQAIMGIPSDRRFLAVASKRLRHLFPRIPGQAGYFKRRRRLTDTLEWLMECFASQSPGFYDDLLLVDSTPIECARSRETVKRSALGDAADYGYCASHSRFFWGFRLHAIFAPDGTPRALTVTSPKRDERDVAIELLARTRRQGTVTLIADKGYAGREFASQISEMNATIIRPRRTSRVVAHTSRRSASASSRSSGPARTSSPSNAMAQEHSPGSESASFNASSPSPPPSRSTTNSPAPAAHSSTTAPNPMESTI
jgi:hypothetical protein